MEKDVEVRNSFMKLKEIYFWTATIIDWRKLLFEDEMKQVIINSLQNLISKNKISLFGFVIMPNHVHFIWEMEQMNGKEKPYASFLKYSAHQFQKILRLKNPSFLSMFGVDEATRKYRFWQRDPLAIRIFSREMLEQKLTYIHNNPLQEHWNLAVSPEAYYYSSAFDYAHSVNRFSILTDYRERV